MRWHFSLLTLLLLDVCGGFRGGIESVPYVETHAEQENPSHPASLH